MHQQELLYAGSITSNNCQLHMEQKKSSRTHKKHNKRRSRAQKALGLLRKEDISDLVLGPLSDQIDHARIQILERIGEVNDSTDILARQRKRDIDAESEKVTHFRTHRFPALQWF